MKKNFQDAEDFALSFSPNDVDQPQGPAYSVGISWLASCSLIYFGRPPSDHRGHFPATEYIPWSCEHISRFNNVI